MAPTVPEGYSNPRLLYRRAEQGRRDDAHISLASPGTDSTVTLCPPTNKAPKPDIILKTKGRESAFLLAKPENIMKTEIVTRNHRNSEMA
jgi:hypothetical protein